MQFSFAFSAGPPLYRPGFLLSLAFHQRCLYPHSTELSTVHAPSPRAVQSFFQCLPCSWGTVTDFPYVPTCEYIFCHFHRHFSILLHSPCTGFHSSASLVSLFTILFFQSVPRLPSFVGTACRHSFLGLTRLFTNTTIGLFFVVILYNILVAFFQLHLPTHLSSNIGHIW